MTDSSASAASSSDQRSRSARRSTKAFDPPTVSLQQLVASAGHSLGEGFEDFTRVATAVQEARIAQGVADALGITRSIGLWTLMLLNQPLRNALEEVGLAHTAFSDTLSIHGTPKGSDATVAMLHENFADAVLDYLKVREQNPPLQAADLGLAILESAERDSSGLLAQRLASLRVDIHAAVSTVQSLTSVYLHPVHVSLADFSQTVRSVREELGASTSVAAARIAEGIQARHPDYADGSFTEVRLRASEGPRATTDQWLSRVRGLYDLESEPNTRQGFIDGRLTLLGLSELDESLAEDLSTAGFLRRLRDEAEVQPRRQTLDNTELSPDAPATVDLLGRDKLAEALAKRLRYLAGPESPTTRSFMVHIDGPWGAGKSTLFEFLGHALRQREDANDPRLCSRFLVVQVNAWREQRVGVQWWTLLSALRRAMSANAPWYKRPILWLAGLVDRIRAGWVPFVAAVLVLAAVLAWLFGATDFDLKGTGAAADSMAKILALVSAAFGGLVAATRLLLPSSRKSAQGFVETSDNPMKELGRLFARTLRRARIPVVFLIDDLDRCDGEYVVKFLEVIQTLVRDAEGFMDDDRDRGRRSRPDRQRRGRQGPYAFVAADGQWIRTSYELHYSAFVPTGAPGRPLGYLFLEKVFQLHVRLPMMTDIGRQSFLQSLLDPRRSQRTATTDQRDLAGTVKAAARTAKSESELINVARDAGRVTDAKARMDILGDVAMRFSERDIESHVEHALTRFGAYLEPNPRSMLLFVNTYGVLRQLRTLEEVLVGTDPLALWAVIEIRWPQLADYLRLHPDAIAEGQKAADAPLDVQVLLSSPAVRAVLSDEKSGGLTPELVRQCSGTPSS